jgi:hypothetical protein
LEGCYYRTRRPVPRYALAKGAETEKQRRLIAKALKVRALPDSSRGVAPALNGLAGTWATDRQYATKIAGVANEVRTAPR